MFHFSRPKLIVNTKPIFAFERWAHTTLRRRTKRGTTDATSRDHILHREIVELISLKNIDSGRVRVFEDIINQFLNKSNSRNVTLRNVEIVAQTSEAEGLAIVPRLYETEAAAIENDGDYRAGESFDVAETTLSKKENHKLTVLKVPKTVPGDIVDVTLRRHYLNYAEADLNCIVLVKSPKIRHEKLVVCKHFDLCQGCQLQMVTYDEQLAFKQNVINKAYKYFYPELDRESLCDFGHVIDSPMQYGYRTKLTPHAKIPRKIHEDYLPLPLGFENVKIGSPVVDVDFCPIAVPSINEKLPFVRKSFQKNAMAQAKGEIKGQLPSTLLLRDSVRELGSANTECLTNPKHVVTETVGNKVFQFPANDFFQNNRSILPIFLDFLRYKISDIEGLFKHIVDAYCGCGFLSISLSDAVPKGGKVFGIELAAPSVEHAQHNARLNGLSKEDAVFVQGNSDDMFTHSEFLSSKVTGEESILLMNPSRKGSSTVFLKQVLQFKPKMIIYVSCNVFSQARDLKHLEKLLESTDVKYDVESITGFDFYPQTKHVESVAILKLRV